MHLFSVVFQRSAFLKGSVACAMFACATLAQARSEWPIDSWLFTSFRGNGDGLHLAASVDGRTWKDLNKVFLKPAVGSGLMRDPHILRGPDGIYRMVWTTGWKDKGIGYASSTDLVNWSKQRYLPFLKKPRAPATRGRRKPFTTKPASSM
jgi:hypothetical protein